MGNTIYFYSEELNFQLNNPNLVREWILIALSKEERLCGAINFIFCSDNYLLDMNVKFLNHNTLTDVITFDSSVGNAVSGDVFISVERVRDNAKDFSDTFLMELYRVIIHGILHLCGYKDKTPEDTAIMRSKEDFYLSLLDQKS